MFFTSWHKFLEGCNEAEEIVLAAPYIKIGTLAQIVERITGRIHVVSRWSLHDIASGVSDVECRELVMSNGGRFFLHPTLHAKYYRFDSTVFIGSANLTAAGMGYGQNANLEVLCPAPEDFGVSEFEAILFGSAHELSDREAAQWTALKTRLTPDSLFFLYAGTPDLSAWFPRARAPYHMWLVYTGRAHMVASSDQRILAQRDLSALSVPPSLTETHFRTWIAECLLLSPFCMDVVRIQTEVDDNRAAVSRLADAWSIAPRTAARRQGTALAWLAHFWE